MHLDMRYKYSAYCAQCRLMFENGEEMFSWEGDISAQIALTRCFRSLTDMKGQALSAAG